MSRGGGRRQEPLFENRLFFGDNLRILRNPAYVRSESVDLIYLDPPFNSGRNYNLLFKARGGTPAATQVKAFEDTWRWGDAASEAYHDTRENAPQHVARTLEAMRKVLNESDMFAYLCMMAPRLVELHKALKSTGSIYLHCDSTASHYLKVLMDAVFGPQSFRNEIVWKRATTVKGNFGQGSRMFGPNTDTILFFTKTDHYTFNSLFTPYTQEYIDKMFRYVEPDTGRRFRLISMIGPGGAAKGNPQYEVMGVTRYWRYSRKMMDKLIAQGLVVQAKPGAVPHRKFYLDEGQGVPVQSLWSDIGNLQASDAERLGYPTQKPVALVERIIQASTNPGEIVLDPFCGCGTTVAAAEGLNRLWLGIDLEYEAIRIIRERLGTEAHYKVYGDPESAENAEQLARDDPYQFQWWAVRRLGARDVEQKKGADKGIDGRLILRSDRYAEAIISVKAGQTGPAHVRELAGTVDRENALFGVLVTLNKPTRAMQAAAADVGGYSDGRRWYPKIQLLNAAEIIGGQQLEYPVEVEALRPAARESISIPPERP